MAVAIASQPRDWRVVSKEQDLNYEPARNEAPLVWHHMIPVKQKPALQGSSTQQFTADFPKGASGATWDVSDQRHLVLLSLTAGSAFHQAVEGRFEVGDRILYVAGSARNAKNMLKVLEDGGSLEVVWQRPSSVTANVQRDANQVLGVWCKFDSSNAQNIVYVISIQEGVVKTWSLHRNVDLKAYDRIVSVNGMTKAEQVSNALRDQQTTQYQMTFWVYPPTPEVATSRTESLALSQRIPPFDFTLKVRMPPDAPGAKWDYRDKSYLVLQGLTRNTLFDAVTQGLFNVGDRIFAVAGKCNNAVEMGKLLKQGGEFELLCQRPKMTVARISNPETQAWGLELMELSGAEGREAPGIVKSLNEGVLNKWFTDSKEGLKAFDRVIQVNGRNDLDGIMSQLKDPKQSCEFSFWIYPSLELASSKAQFDVTVNITRGASGAVWQPMDTQSLVLQSVKAESTFSTQGKLRSGDRIVAVTPEGKEKITQVNQMDTALQLGGRVVLSCQRPNVCKTTISKTALQEWGMQALVDIGDPAKPVEMTMMRDGVFRSWANTCRTGLKPFDRILEVNDSRDANDISRTLTTTKVGQIDVTFLIYPSPVISELTMSKFVVTVKLPPTLDEIVPDCEFDGMEGVGLTLLSMRAGSAFEEAAAGKLRVGDRIIGVSVGLIIGGRVVGELPLMGDEVIRKPMEIVQRMREGGKFEMICQRPTSHTISFSKEAHETWGIQELAAGMHSSRPAYVKNLQDGIVKTWAENVQFSLKKDDRIVSVSGVTNCDEIRSLLRKTQVGKLEMQFWIYPLVTWVPPSRAPDSDAAANSAVQANAHGLHVTTADVPVTAPFEFALSLSLGTGAGGAEWDTLDGTSLVLQSVERGSPFDRAVSGRLEAGDRIIDICGICGSARNLFAAMRRGGQLEMIIQRPKRSTVALLKSAEPWGVQFAHSQTGNSLLLERVNEGIIKRWSREHAGGMKENDRVIEISREQDCAKMLQIFANATIGEKLEMKFWSYPRKIMGDI